MTSRFDRVRPRTGDAARRGDAQGRQALFSVPADRPESGAVVVECSACGRRSGLGPAEALRLLVPSLHLWPLRRGHPSLVRCPACGRFAWTRISVRL